jgi:hypothetical protein
MYLGPGGPGPGLPVMGYQQREYSCAQVLAVVLFPRPHHRGAKPHKADQNVELFREQNGVSREGQAEDLLRAESEGPRNKSRARGQCVTSRH